MTNPTPLSTTETLKRYRKFVEGKLKKDEPIKMIDFISQDRTALIKFFLESVGEDDPKPNKDVLPLGYECAAARNHLRDQLRAKLEPLLK